MAKHWVYSDASLCIVGDMVCVACRQKISAGLFRYYETDEAYHPQHKVCAPGDPEWTRISERAVKQERFQARRLLALRDFIKEFGRPDIDDIEEAWLLCSPQEIGGPAHD